MEEVRRVAVLGAGTMGHGIAQVAALGGFRTALHDVSAECLSRGLRAVEGNLQKGVERGKVEQSAADGALAHLRAEEDFSAAVDDADLIIEAVPEKLELKQDVFRRLDGAAPEHAVLATNTSSLPVGEIAAATSRPEKVVGMHFFNPVHIMPLLEVVRADRTSEETVSAAAAVGARMGKECIVVKDTPGFATSRLGVVIGLEAMRMLEAGVATAEDIDKAMTLGYRHPIGPLRLSDLVGLDTRLAIARHLHETLGSEAFRPPEILHRLVSEGKLGKKTGRGFYEWPQA